MAKVGDYVSLKTKDGVFVGRLMPDSASGKRVIKLDSGYNVGFEKKNVKQIKLLKKKTVKKGKASKIKKSKNLPKITILQMGGTLASKVDYETGGVVAQFKPSEIINMFPELGRIANIDAKLVGNVMGGDMNFSHYNLLAKAIQKEVKKGVEGFIVTHGTDTLHYTSAALSFILEGLGVPVVLVGAQRSSDRGSSDSGMNLICATHFIVNSAYSGVAVCMHESMNDDYCSILPGLKVRKFHTSRRDAFKVVNAKPLARVSRSGKVSIISKLNKKEGDLKLKLIDPKLKIGFLKAHPNLNALEVSRFSGFDGLVVEGTGLGHLPVDKKILTEIKKLSKKIPIVMCSQCVFGRVNMNVYAYGRVYSEYTSSGKDMTSEAAFIKLAWLLSNYKKDVIPMIGKNIRGEINPRIIDEFL